MILGRPIWAYNIKRPEKGVVTCEATLKLQVRDFQINPVHVAADIVPQISKGIGYAFGYTKIKHEHSLVRREDVFGIVKVVIKITDMTTEPLNPEEYFA